MESNHNLLPDEAAPTGVDGFDVVHAPRVVVGDRGAGWIVEGWDLFKLAIPGWLSLALVGVAWLLLEDHFKILRAVTLLLDPVWTAGLLLACQANYQRQPVKILYVVAGFRRNLGRLIAARLIVIGLTLLVTGLALGDLAWTIFNNEQLQTLIRKISEQADPTSQEFMNDILQLDAAIGLTGFLMRLLIILLLVIPLSAAGWFAPALIVLGNCDIKTALWYSLKASTTNLFSFFIYGLLLLLMSLLGVLPWHVGLLLLIPLFYLSMYLSYRDIFVN